MAEHASQAGHDDHENHDAAYIKIWGILLVLLVISVAGPLLEIQIVTLITALVIKHFMHLTVEKAIVKWLLVSSVVLMVLMWAGIAPDVQNHEGRNWTNVAAQAAVERGLPEPGEHAEEDDHAPATTFAGTGVVVGDPPIPPAGPLPGGYNLTHLVFWGVVGLVAVGTNAVAIMLSAGAGLLVFETLKGDSESG